MVEKQLFQIIRYILNNEPVTMNLDWLEVWSIAKLHSLEQFIYVYMKQISVDKRPEEKLFREIEMNHAAMVTRQVHQNLVMQEIHSLLEDGKCYHLFMKGCVTKRRYPNSFYRSMSDIDFLYRNTQHERVKSILLANGFSGYQEGRKNDIYYRIPYVCVEAHRQLVPSDSSFFQYCANVWERAHTKEGCKYCYEMSLEDELIFNVIHLAIHFLEGGAGIRFILDVYIYNHLQYDFEYVQRELKKIDLLEFYCNISDLAEKWFGKGKETPISEKLDKFILASGTFGTAENAHALAVREGHWKYLLKMCFPSYGEMTSIYPWLIGKRLLLPLAWLIRGVKVLRLKKGKLHSQIKKTKHGNRILGQELYRFYKECGLRSIH